MKSIIISAFSGTGKSYLTKNVKKAQYRLPGTGVTIHPKFHDSDSSKYSWIYDEDGNKTDQRDPNFPDNYMEHIRSLMEEDGNIIFVSTHESVREALIKAGFSFYIIRPALHLRDQYLENYRKRGSSEEFIDLIDKNWIRFLTDIDKFQNMYMEKVTLVELRKDVYMEQAISILARIGFLASPSRIIIYSESNQMIEAMEDGSIMIKSKNEIKEDN